MIFTGIYKLPEVCASLLEPVSNFLIAQVRVLLEKFWLLVLTFKFPEQEDERSLEAADVWFGHLGLGEEILLVAKLGVNLVDLFFEKLKLDEA